MWAREVWLTAFRGGARSMDKAFTKGLRLLEVLARSNKPRGITDLANELELTKSNVHRLLATLLAKGFVQQIPPNSAYELTLKIWEMGNCVVRRMDLVSIARPAMERLAQATGETVHLSVLDDTDVVYVAKIESIHQIRAHTSVGMRAPAYAMATGKAMLAHEPDALLERFRPLLKRYTSTTRVTLEDLQADIAQVRQQGYAVVLHGEWREGIAACACAILGRAGEVAGAIGISGPDTRLRRKEMKQFSEDVRAAARAISTALGHRPQH